MPHGVPPERSVVDLDELEDPNFEPTPYFTPGTPEYEQAMRNGSPSYDRTEQVDDNR